MLVANQHAGLDRIFEKTRWERGRWVQALRYLPDARTWESVRFAGIEQRSTALPNALLPKGDWEG